MIGIFLSGITAFPIQTEINWLANHCEAFPLFLQQWIFLIQQGVNDVYPRYPFLAYGTDWLAFAHIVIGLAFWGVYQNPKRNIWVVQWGILCCLLVIPTAFTCGIVRDIPMFHILIDCSFGIFGGLLLLLLKKKINALPE